MNDKINENFHLVDSDEKLADIVTAFDGEDRIAVDLEADSMFHFKEKVCLIQMGTEDLTVVIDPLKVNDLSPLKPLFADPGVQKILHGSDYDVRSLHRDFDITINNLFDTELAGRFLGIRETGLGSVLKSRFDVTLDKKYQKKDWSRRPLSDGMIAYAAGDVFYLLPLAAGFENELAEKGRTGWVAEECQLLSRVRQIQPDGEPLYMRFKGAGRLDGRSLATLECLLQYRMALAEKKDKPLFKVMGNNSLLQMAKERPKNMGQLKALKVISPKQVSMYGQRLLERVEEGRAVPKKELPVYPKKRAPRLNAKVPARIKKIKAWRDVLAEELAMDPSLLLNKAQMTTISVSNPTSVEEVATIEEIKNWQKAEFSDAIVSALHA